MADNEIHLKSYPIEIYHTFDDSSGVEDLYIYGQPTPSIIDTDGNYIAPDFESAEIVGILRSVGTLPSKALETVYTTENKWETPISIKITYHDNPSGTPPEVPIEDGTLDGWHVNATSSANWISQKVDDNYGKSFWSDPIDVSSYTIPDGQTNPVELQWKGVLDAPPSNPYFDWVYKDLTTGIVYQFDETERDWLPMLLDGTDDVYGTGTWYHPPRYDEELLRDKYGYPESDPGYSGESGHGPFNKYIFRFNTYQSGFYYYFWVRAKDKQGNLEWLNPTGETNSKEIPLITTAVPLVDTEAPEFNSTELLDDLVYESGYYYCTGPGWLATSPNGYSALDRWIGSRRVLHFLDGVTPHSRYIDFVAWDNAGKRVQILISDQAGLGALLTEVYLTDISSAKAGVGQVNLNIPACDDANLAGYLIYRRNEVLLSAATDGTVAYEHLVGVTKSYDYTDYGLVFTHDDMQLPENQKFQYKIVPISKYTTDGEIFAEDFSNAIMGKASFNAIPETSSDIGTIADVLTYYPSSGIAPLPILLNYNNGTGGDEWFEVTEDGQILLKWCRDNGVIGIADQDGDQPLVTLDVNNDIKGFEIERMLEEKFGPTGDWRLQAPLILTQAAYTDFPASEDSQFEHTFLDSNLESYNANGDLDPTSPLYRLVRYQYRIRAFDYGGNAGEWSYFNETERSIVPNDITPPDTAEYELKVNGMLGGWRLEFVDHSLETTTIEISRQHVSDASASMIELYNGQETNIIGRYDVTSSGVVNITDTVAPSHSIWWARYQVRGKDKNENWTELYPVGWTTPVASLTLESALDKWPPKPPTDVLATYDRTEGYVEVSWTLPTEENVLDATASTTISGTTITVSGASWTANEFDGKYVRILSGTGQDSWGAVSGSDADEITVSAWNGTQPVDEDTFEVYGSPLTDLDGVHITKIKLAENDGDPSAIVTGIAGLTVTASAESWDPSSGGEWVGYYVKVTEGASEGTIGRISSNTETTATVESWLGPAPEIDDIFKIFSGQDTYLQTAGDTNSAADEVWYDYNLTTGAWQYSVHAYDLSGNKSDRVNAEYITNITDVIPPPIPIIQNVIGGLGTLLFTWTPATTEPVDYYEIYVKDKDGKSIFTATDGFYNSGTRVIAEYYKKAYNNNLLVFSCSDILRDVARYSVKIIAVDLAGNKSLSTEYVKICTTFRDNGLPTDDPARGWPEEDAPSAYLYGRQVFDESGSEITSGAYNPTDHYCKADLIGKYFDVHGDFDATLPAADPLLLSSDDPPRALEYTYTDYAGNVSLRIGTGANKFETSVGSVAIYKRLKPPGGTYGEYGYVTLRTVSIDTIGSILAGATTGINFMDYALGNYTVQYRVHQISHNNIIDVTGDELPEIDAVDMVGFDLNADHDDFTYIDFHNLVTASVYKEPGKFQFHIPDVMDKEYHAYFEVFRTPFQYYDSSATTPWDVDTFYSTTRSANNLLVLGKNSSGSDAWEKIETVNSTAGYDPADYFIITDDDWSLDGDIEDPALTKFSAVEYQNHAMYAIVATDRWGNRGKPYFIYGFSDGDSSGGTVAHGNTWIEMPAAPRKYYVEISTPYYEIKYDEDGFLIAPSTTFNLQAKVIYGKDTLEKPNPYFRWSYNDNPDLSGPWTDCPGQDNISNEYYTVDPTELPEDWVVRTYQVDMYSSYNDTEYDEGEEPYTHASAVSLAEDTQGIFKLSDGVPTLYAKLTKDNALLQTDEYGKNVVDYSGAVTTMNIYRGFEDISSQFAFARVHDGTGTTTVVPTSGSQTYSLTNIDDDDNVVNIDITGTKILADLSELNLTKTFTVTKSHFGASAKYVKTILSSKVINYHVGRGGSAYVPDEVLASLDIIGFTPSAYQWYYKKYNETTGWGSAVEAGMSDTETFSSGLFDKDHQLLEVWCEVTDENILNLDDPYSDHEFISLVTGGSGFVFGLENSNITIPCTKKGIPIGAPYANDIYYCDVYGYHNNQTLSYVEDSTTDGEFYISNITKLPNGDEVSYTKNTSTGRISINNISTDPLDEYGILDVTFTTTTWDGQTINETKRITVNKSDDAWDARYIKIVADGQVFTYPKKSAIGYLASPENIHLETFIYNIESHDTNDPTYAWTYKNPDSAGFTSVSGKTGITGGSGETLTVNHASEIFGDTDNVELKCTVTDPYDSETFEDIMSLHKNYFGSGYTAVLSNENVSVPCFNNLTGSILDEAYTDVTAYDGTTQLSYNTSVEAGESFYVSIPTGGAVGCVAVVHPTTGQVSLSSIEDEVKQATVKIRFHFDSISEVVIDRTMTITKAPEGHEAKYTRTTADSYVFRYPRKLDGTPPIPTSIEIRSDVFGMQGSITRSWEYKPQGFLNWYSFGSSGETFTLQHDNALLSSSDVFGIRCHVIEDWEEVDYDYYDPITIVRSYDGSGYTPIVTNENMSIPCDPDLTNATNYINNDVHYSDFLAYADGARLDYDDNPEAGNSFYITVSPGDGITLSSISNPDGQTARVRVTALADTVGDPAEPSYGSYFDVTFHFDPDDTITMTRRVTVNKAVPGYAGISVDLSTYNSTIKRSVDGAYVAGELGSSGRVKTDVLVYYGDTEFTYTAGTPDRGEFSVGYVYHNFASPLIGSNGTYHVDTDGLVDDDATGGVTFTIDVNVTGNIQTFTKQWQVNTQIDGDSPYKSTVFLRKAPPAPDAPVGGTFDSPYPNPNTDGWSDGIPPANTAYEDLPDNTLWMSTRIFAKSALEPPQQATWTDPEMLSDSPSVQIEYSSTEVDPGTPSTEPLLWDPQPLTSSIWMAVRTLINGAWGDWVVTKIKGEKGDPADTVTAEYSESGIGTPATDPDEWDPTYDSLDKWIIFSYDGGLTWGNPVRILGAGGKGVVLWFTRWATEPTEPPQSATTTPYVGVDATWEDYPPSGTQPLWMTKNEYDPESEEMVNAWSTPVRLDSDPAFKSIVFARSVSGVPPTQLTTQGSYASPVPAGWSDGIPAGSEQLWSSSRIFTLSGNPPQQNSWTTQQAMTDTATMDIEYSEVETPGTPATHPANWHDTATEDDIWMAIQITTNGIAGSWSVSRIKGEAGNSIYTATVYKQQDAPAPSSPSGGSYNFATDTLTAPDTWSVNQPASTTTPTWACSFTFVGTPTETVNGGTWGTVWLDAQLGEDGADGGNGDSIAVVEVYQESGSGAPPLPGTCTYNFTSGDLSGTLNSWVKNMPTVTTTPMYMSTCRFVSATTEATSDAWTAAVIIAREGDGGESSFKSTVFKRSTTEPAPPGDGEGSYANPVPTGWSDGIPTGSLIKLWSTTRIFTASGNPPQQTSWTDVALMTNTFSTEYQYNEADIDADPGVPPAAGWHTFGTPSDNWMAKRDWEDGVAQSWEVFLIKGETGDSGLANRLDIAYGIDNIGTSWNYPTGTYETTYNPASSTGKTWMGTNMVTWTAGTTEPEPSDTVGDYEWTKWTGDDGVDGGAGYSNRIDIAYADDDEGLNADYPSGKLTLNNYNAATIGDHTYQGTNVETWAASEEEPIVSETAEDYEWTKFIGDPGARTAKIIMYKWALTQPTSNFPSGTSTYTWATGQFTAPSTPNGWTVGTTNPPANGYKLWFVQQTYTDSLTTLTSNISWSATSCEYFTYSAVDGTTVKLQYSSNSTNGIDGTWVDTKTNAHTWMRTGTKADGETVYTYATGTIISGNAIFVGKVYLQQSGTPTTPSGGTYNFETDTLTAPIGWNITQPSTNTTPTWSCTYTFIGYPTQTVTAGTWSTPITEAVAGDDGSDGGNGTSVALVQLYKIGNSPIPTGTQTYDFTTGNVTGGTMNGWTVSMPTVTTSAMYMIAHRFTAVDPATTDTTSSWSTPVIIAQNGEVGPQGDTGPGIVYRGAWSSSTTYTFSTTRRDVVLSGGTYYICKTTHSNQAPPNATYWDTFGSTFSSVATDLLLANNQTITKTLTMGSATTPGIIRSYSATDYDEGTGSGFYLGDNGDGTVVARIGTVSGNAITNGMMWDGNSFTFKGDMTSGSTITGATITGSSLYTTYNELYNYTRLKLNEGTITFESSQTSDTASIHYEAQASPRNLIIDADGRISLQASQDLWLGSGTSLGDEIILSTVGGTIYVGNDNFDYGLTFGNDANNVSLMRVGSNLLRVNKNFRVDGSFQFDSSGPTISSIQDATATLTDVDTAIPTSAAIIDYITGLGGGTMSSFVVKDGDTTQVTIHDSEVLQLDGGDGIISNYTTTETSPFVLTLSANFTTSGGDNGDSTTVARGNHNHAITGLSASGLTSGQFLKATGTTTYGFAAHGLTASDVGALSNSSTSMQFGYFGYTHVADTVNNNKYLRFASTGIINDGPAYRVLTFDVNNISRTIDLAGNLTFSNAFTTSGGHAITFTTAGTTTITLPETGTLSVQGHTHNVESGGIDDIVITGPMVEKEVLSWSDGTSKWINRTLSEAGIAPVDSPEFTTAATLNGDDLATQEWVDNNYLDSADLTGYAKLGVAQDWTANQEYQDGVRLYFGTSGDAYITYDGTGDDLIMTHTGTGTIQMRDDPGYTYIEVGYGYLRFTDVTTANHVITTDGSNNVTSLAKGTAFNKNFGETTGTVAEGDHTHDFSGDYDKYDYWTISDGSNTEGINSTGTLTVTGTGATTAVFNPTGNVLTISSTDNNTWRAIDTTPTQNVNDESISSGWAYSHVNATDGSAHVISGIINLSNELSSKIPNSQKGQASGVAELDATGKVPSSQLPSFVDDVLEYANFVSLPGTGSSGIIYITIDDNKTYRWGGSSYAEISSSLALGETSTTAYRGDRGAIAYDHSTESDGNPHNVTKTDLGLSNVENTALSTWTGSTAITTLGTITAGTIPWDNISSKPTYDNYANWNVEGDGGTPYAVTSTSLVHIKGGTGITTSNASGVVMITNDQTAYTDEDIQDLVGAMINITGTQSGMNVAYNDTSGKLDIDLSHVHSYDNYQNWQLRDDGGEVVRTITSTSELAIEGGVGISVDWNVGAGVLLVSNDYAAGTDLGKTVTATQITVTSSTGSNVILAGAVAGTDAGLMTATDKTKLDGIATSANNYSHPTYDGDDIDVDTGALLNAAVISDIDFNITTDSLGHVTDANAAISTRNLTAANIGAQPSSTNLTSLSGLTYVSPSFVKLTNTGTFTLDNNTYLTSANLSGYATETWVGNNYDNYVSWTIRADNDSAESGGDTIISGEGVRFTGGTQITTSRSDSDITITNDAPNVTTNLSTTYAATTFTINSSDGDNAQVLQAIASGNAGAMSGADKAKLDGIAINADKYTSWTISSGSGDDQQDTIISGERLTVEGDGGIVTSLSGGILTITDGPNSSTNLGKTVTATQITVTSSTGSNVILAGAVAGTDAGLMTATDKTKLDGIATSANNYSHPTYDGDDIDVDTGGLTGATVISDLDFNVTTDALGHVTDANAAISTRNLTAANVGAVPKANSAAGTFDGAYLTFGYAVDNIDHIRSDDTANAYHFVHDGTYTTAGNSTLVAGKLTLNNLVADSAGGNYLTETSGVVYYRTAAQVLADIGAQAAGSYDNYSSWTVAGGSGGGGTHAVNSGTTLTVEGDNGITAAVTTGVLTISGNGYTYTHPSYDGDDIDVDTGALLNAAVISDIDFNITTDSLGHVTDANAAISTRNLTAANIGALSSSTSSTQNGYFGNIYLRDDSTPSHYLAITSAENLTANATLSIVVNNGSKTLTIPANASVSGTNTGDQTSVSGQAGYVANSVTFTTSGGAAAGTTYNGVTARTISYATVGAAASSHTHGNLSSGGAFTGTTKTAGHFYSGTVEANGTTRLNYDGYLYATRVYNAYYNDIADYFIDNYGDEPEPGYCYYMEKDGKAYKTKKVGQHALLGIVSDTYGFALGKDASNSPHPIGLAGFVLAYVKEEYAPGTLLTGGKNGILEELNLDLLTKHPDAHIATFIRKEENQNWHNLNVNGRCWVKIK
jgi:hypothetical protein